MKSDRDTPSGNPEPIAELLSTLPAKVLLTFAKENPQLSHVVFQGFTARERSLTIPVVRQRYESELEKNPEIAEKLLKIWLDTYAGLMAALADEAFVPSNESFAALLRRYERSAIHYALVHSPNEHLQQYVDQLPAMIAKPQSSPPKQQQPSHPAVVQQPSGGDMKARQEEQKRLAALEHERDTLKHEVAQSRKQLEDMAEQVKTLQHANADAERRFEREQRRVRKVEEELERVRKELRQRKNIATALENQAPNVPDEVINSVNEAIASLQRGLSAVLGSPEEVVTPPPPAKAQPKPAATNKPDITIALPTRSGKNTFTVTQLLAGLHHNNQELLDKVRDGLAYLADNPGRERIVIAELTKAGIPDALLTGPLRPAIIDGSNVANANPKQKRARFAYLGQIQRSAWREGYFPVYIIVDASLRHQIDRSDLLMEAVDAGEITMAPAGSSADQLLIEEAKRQHAVLITNDRMNDWPDAKNIEKRHVELIGGTVCVGSFHRTRTLWFR